MEYILYGVSSRYLHEVTETIGRLGATVRAFVHNLPEVDPPSGLQPLATPDSVADEWLALPLSIPLITPGHRSKLESEAVALGFHNFTPLVDPTAVLARSTTLAAGVSINAGVVIGANCVLGRFVLVNRSASVGHDARIDAYATLGPACVLCGSCHIEAGAFIGAGAILTPDVTIGRNAIVGAGAVVLEDVPAHSVVVGNPARVVRTGIAGYNQVSV